jgi:hypothetical protein
MAEFASGNQTLSATMETHLIDDLQKFGVWNDDYDLFLEKRAEAIGNELKQRLIAREIDQKGQVLKEDD